MGDRFTARTLEHDGERAPTFAFEEPTSSAQPPNSRR
jgi:hypothetical protein